MRSPQKSDRAPRVDTATCVKTLRDAEAPASFRVMRSLILSLIVGVSTPAWSQDAEPAPATTDPTVETADIAFDGPEPVIVESDEGQHVFSAELATTMPQMQRGLMWRDSLAEDAGMLFHYPAPRRAAMWMDNTLIDLDILFIEPDGRIFKIVAHAQAGSRRSLEADAVVAGVLEIPAGRAFELGLRPGDIVRHELFGNLDDSGAPAEAAEDAPQDAQ